MGALSREELDQFRETARRLSDGWHDAALADMIGDCEQAGLMSLMATENSGGLGLESSALTAVLEPLARVNAAAACTVLLQACAQAIMARATLGTPAPDVSRKITLLPDSGCSHDVLPKQREGKILGTARNVPLSSDADFLLSALADTPATLALIPRAGFRKVTPVRTLGLRDWGIGDIDICHHEATMVEAVDFQHMWGLLARGLVAIILGLMRTSFANALEYAQQRRQGGRLITGWGEVRRLLGEMEADIATVEASLNGLSVSECKVEWVAIRALRLAARCTDHGVQLLGGNGYMRDFGQERLMRDVRQLQMLIGGLSQRHRRLSMPWKNNDPD